MWPARLQARTWLRLRKSDPALTSFALTELVVGPGALRHDLVPLRVLAHRFQVGAGGVDAADGAVRKFAQRPCA